MKITFNLYPNVKAEFQTENNIITNVKILTKIPRGSYYNSILNDAGKESEKINEYILNVVSKAHNGNNKIIETDDFISGIVYAYEFNNLTA